jgi:hypothetical protein
MLSAARRWFRSSRQNRSHSELSILFNDNRKYIPVGAVSTGNRQSHGESEHSENLDNRPAQVESIRRFASVIMDEQCVPSGNQAAEMNGFGRRMPLQTNIVDFELGEGAACCR